MKITTGLLFGMLLMTTLLAQTPKEIAVQFSTDSSAAFFQQYQYLHAHPENSTQEKNTAALLKNKMQSMGYRIVDSMGYHNFAAILENGKGPVILYRTDMDGLPILENTSLPFASKDSSLKDGIRVPSMHACGHDIHMSTWLALANLMSKNKKQWKGTLVFLAQSAEETGQGARKAVSTDAFKNLPQPNLQLAIHDHAELQTGQIGFCNGFSMAAVDMMDITIFGKGGHGAAPQNCIDPIVLSAQYINAIQTIVSRNLSSNDPAIVTVGAIHGGTVGNVIPDQVLLRLTIRSYSAEARTTILNRLKQIGDQLALAAGLPTDKLPLYTLLDMSIPSVYNNPELGDRIRNIVTQQFGADAATPMKPIMLGEDFGVYGQLSDKIPSYILWTGTVSEERKRNSKNGGNALPQLHTAGFAPDAAATLKANVAILGTCLLEMMR